MHLYTEHFNLNLLPFENVPDPLFFYDYGDYSRIHKQISGSLLQRGRGLIVIIGPIGSGKTTLSQMIKSDFPENIKLIWIAEPPANSTDLYLFLAQELGLQPSSSEKTFVMRDIRNALLKINSEEKKCLVIIDESHLMSDDVINGIRLLNNLEEGSIKLVQLLLLGREELMEKINRPEMEPFKQRIAGLEILGKMNVDTMRKYVLHRIQIAGGTTALISDTGWEALSIAFSTGGTPRTINSLCDRSFIVAFERKKTVVDEQDIYEATQRMGLTTELFHYISSLKTREKVSQESQPASDKPVPETAVLGKEQPPPSFTGKTEQRRRKAINEVRGISRIRMGIPELSQANRKGLKVPVRLLLIVLILLLIGAAAWFFFQDKDSPLSSNNKPQPLIPQDATTLLRFHGSNTIGGKLLPALATAFLQKEGYTNVHKKEGIKEDESFIVGERNGNREQIEIQDHGSSTAFKDLKDGLCDIGMSSRKIKSEEQQKLAFTLGDHASNASEHVLALDGIALIVHQSNTIKTLSVEQVADIFSGTLTDWSQLSGRAGAITVYARDDKSGTYDFFEDTVLKPHGKTIAANAQRFEDSQKLSDAVSNDPDGIGFIGLNYIGTNKVIALSDTDVDALKPSLLTVKTEDYRLSRRLYLYTAEKPTNPNVYKFIEFAVGSNDGKQIVASTGLVNLDPTPDTIYRRNPNDVRNRSARWRSLTKDATEIATRFRFRGDSEDLDTRTNRDIERIVYLLSHPPYSGKEVILIGFTDASGSPEYNKMISQRRADIMKKALDKMGVTVQKAVGLGAEAFVAPNGTHESNVKNRRVEVWVK